MKTHFTFKHMNSSEAVKDHATEKSEKMSKFVGEATEMHWIFFVENETHVVDLHVKGPHIDMFAQAKTEDMHQSIDSATEKMEKQLRKQKEITKNHLHRDRSEPALATDDSEE